MFEFALSDLRKLCAGDKGKDDVCRKPLFEVLFDTEGVSGVDEDASVLWSDDRLDDGGDVVNVR